MKIISPGPSTALAAAALAVAILKSEAAEGDKKPLRKRLNGPKSTTITDHRDLMSMPAVEGIMPGQPAPVLTPDFTPDFSITFLEEICPTCPTCPSDAPSLRPSQGPSDVPSQSQSPSTTPVATFGIWDPYTYSRKYYYYYDEEIETDWFINTDCGPRRGQCYQAGDFKGDEDNCPEAEEVPVVDTDVEVRSIRKKMPEHHNGIEAITHLQYTILENKFKFEEQGFLTFDLYCSSEENHDFCYVYVCELLYRCAEVMMESGKRGWMNNKAIAVPKGEVNVIWAYWKDDICSKNDDTMKLDNIKFIPSPDSIVVADENLVDPSEE